MPSPRPPFAPSEADRDDPAFLDERPGAPDAWHVLIVDADAAACAATHSALDQLEVGGRALAVRDAGSSEQARAMVDADPELALLLLDVSIEHGDSALQLLRDIRTTLGRTELRILLRASQPGSAPAFAAIRDFDIDHYDLHPERSDTAGLCTAVASALRAYGQIRALNAGQRGMDRVAHAMFELIGVDDAERFGAAIIEHSAAILGLAPAGILCLEEPRGTLSPALTLRARPSGPVADPQPRADQAMRTALQRRRNVYRSDCTALYCAGKSSRACVVWLDTGRPLSALEQRLLDVFGASVGVGLDNLQLLSRLREAAFTDQLVKLPNRTRLIDVIDAALAGPERDQAVLSLIDLDHFAETNDALGHQFGDLLLVAVGARLQGQLSGHTVARVGGDIFAVLGPASLIHPTAILGMFDAPFSIDGQDVQVTATLGLLRLAEHDGSGADALKDADIALKRAKTQQRAGHFYFSRSMGVEIRERVRIMHALRNGFARGDLFLMYQPQIDLASRRPVGAEALLRWQTPDGNFISPDRFIPIAEYSGLIIDIGEWVLRSACHELVRLRAAGHVDFTMSVNVSQVQFRHPYFLDMLRAALADTKAPPECIELEITESMAMEEPDLLVRMLAQVKHLGVSIAIDDFGTGFSSLSYLQRLQVDRLKIDRAFVREITVAGKQTRGSSIAEMVIQLGRNLGLTVIAEGVEDERQAEILQQLGCPLGQGFLFARPMATSALYDWLVDQKLRLAIADGPRLAST